MLLHAPGHRTDRRRHRLAPPDGARPGWAHGAGRRLGARRPGRAARAGHVVTATGDSAEIAYPVVLWRPGRHTVEPAGPAAARTRRNGGFARRPAGDARGRERAAAAPPRFAGASAPRRPRVPAQHRQPDPAGGALAGDAAAPAPACTSGGAGGASRHARPLHRCRGRSAGKPRWRAGPTPGSTARSRTWPPPGSALRVAATGARGASGLDTERVLAELAAARPEWPLDGAAVELLRALDDVRFGTGAHRRGAEPLPLAAWSCGTGCCASAA